MANSVVNENYTITIMQYPTSSADPVTIQAPMPESFMYDAASQYSAPFTGGLTGNQMIDTILRVGLAARLVTQSLTAQFWQGSTETELGLEIEFQAERDPDLEVRQQVLKLLRLTTPTSDRAGLLTSPGPKIGKELLEKMMNDAREGIGLGPEYDKAAQTVNPATNQQQSTSSGMNIPGTGPNLNGSFVASSNPNVGPGQLNTCGMKDPSAVVTNGSQNTSPQNTDGQEATFGTADYFNQYIEDRISIKIGNYMFFNSVVVTNVQTTFESQFDVNGLPHYARVAVRFKPLFMVTQNDLTKIFSSPGASSTANGQGSSGSLMGGVAGGTAIGSFEGLSPAVGQVNTAVQQVSNKVEAFIAPVTSTIQRVKNAATSTIDNIYNGVSNALKSRTSV